MERHIHPAHALEQIIGFAQIVQFAVLALFSAEHAPTRQTLFVQDVHSAPWANTM